MWLGAGLCFPTLNATTDYVVTASLDSCWNFYDIESGQCLVSVNAMEQVRWTRLSHTNVDLIMV